MKPILFNTEMVRAIQDGTKTVTRRVVKPQPKITPIPTYGGSYRISMDKNLFAKPPYHPGDILYVRETWSKDPFSDGFIYPAEHPGAGHKWHPSIHMPREAARIFLRVTDVRVERLQDSFFKHGNTIFYLQREGIDIGEQCRECIDTYGSPICNDHESECGMLDEVRSNFSDLWDSTIKPADRALYDWDSNPWAWVIEFERINREDA